MTLDHITELSEIAEESSVYIWQRDFDDLTPAAIRERAAREGLDPDVLFERLLDARDVDDDDTYGIDLERHELLEVFEACETEEDFALLEAWTDFKTEALTEQRPPE